MTRLERIRADLASGGVFYGAAGPMTLITKEDVAWLVQGKQELAQLLALKQAGLAKAKLVKLRQSVVQVVAEAVLERLRGKG